MRRLELLLAVGLACALAAGSTLALAVPPGSPPSSVTVVVPAGTVLELRGFAPFANFTVPAPGGVFEGKAWLDHFVWIMAYGNTTPLPMCADLLGWSGNGSFYSPDEVLAPGFYHLGPVCGGFANLTVLDSLKVVAT